MFQQRHAAPRPLTLLLAACALLLPFTASAGQPAEDTRTWPQRTALAMHTLQAWYNPATGLYDTTKWWNAANAITTLADYSRVTGSKQYLDVFPNTLANAPKLHAAFLNDFYDDEGWWALAWIDVYDLTHDPRYLATAESIFTDMTGAWDDNTCHGGIWWSRERKYKNAIANELFLSVAAHLASRSTTPAARRKALTWANREWKWFSQSTMIDLDHLINDGLDAACKNNGKTKWSYNQGVILGGLAALANVTHDPALLDTAGSIANATMTSPITTAGPAILHDPCEPGCGEDGTQFKGIFLRNLDELSTTRPSPAARTFILANATSIWNATDKNSYKITVDWQHPNGPADASTQSSALDALVAASHQAP